MLRFACSLVLAAALSVPAAAAETTKSPSSAAGWRLSNEASPYLRQHADNPIAWFPWGEEAFAEAKKTNKPIFLSVGYSTCYWCHVMERESFVNDAIAKIVNENFIAIKVDRERRPDVDATYMIATELITQGGGWPNSVFLTPDLKPFYALTYAPADQFTALLNQVTTTWKNEEKPLREDADRIAGMIQQYTQRQSQAVEITPKARALASLKILSGFDAFNGGLGTAPKFPRESVLAYLLHRAERDGDELAREALELTLDNMIRGGINDHLSGGFHRYATDNEWAVPHFEKMLYNQALIARLLNRSYELTGRKTYADAARRTLDFVLRDMTTEDGSFASAFDAETDGKEGLYYLWTKEEVDTVLGEDAAFAATAFGITEDGNHEGMNTLRLSAPVDELAATLKLDAAAFDAKLQAVTSKLREAQQARKPLKRDDKITADWNAAMIATFAEASVVLSQPRYLDAAKRAMAVLADKLAVATPEMQRTYFDNVAGLDATQADHAEVGLAAIQLFDAEQDVNWLDLAKRSASIITQRFADKVAGDYYLTASATGFVRTKQYDDSDLQSGNAAALELFASLARRDPDPQWRHAADGLAATLSGLADRSPLAMAASLTAIDIHQRGETGPRQYLAKGAVRAVASRDCTTGKARVELHVAPGWHINANKPSEEFLIPTVVTLDGNQPADLVYPPTIERKLAFNDAPLQLYEGRVELSFALPEKAEAEAASEAISAREVTLSVQACSDKICLEPETVRLTLPPSVATR